MFLFVFCNVCGSALDTWAQEDLKEVFGRRESGGALEREEWETLGRRRAWKRGQDTGMAVIFIPNPD